MWFPPPLYHPLPDCTLVLSAAVSVSVHGGCAPKRVQAPLRFMISKALVVLLQKGESLVLWQLKHTLLASLHRPAGQT